MYKKLMTGVVVAGMVLAAASAMAAAGKTYQVTGPVKELTINKGGYPAPLVIFRINQPS